MAARESGRTFEISASRATPAYIYAGFGDFGNPRYFRKLLIFGIKIITENQELLFRLRKNIFELQKILENFLGIDGRMRNTTKVVSAP